MSPEDDSENSIEASSATACHCVVLKAINKARYKCLIFKKLISNSLKSKKEITTVAEVLNQLFFLTITTRDRFTTVIMKQSTFLSFLTLFLIYKALSQHRTVDSRCEKKAAVPEVPIYSNRFFTLTTH